MSLLWIKGRITLFYSLFTWTFNWTCADYKSRVPFIKLFSSYFLLCIVAFMILLHYVMFFLLFVRPLKHHTQLCKRLSSQNNLRILHPQSQPTYSPGQLKFQLRFILYWCPCSAYLYLQLVTSYTCYSFSLLFHIELNLF